MAAPGGETTLRPADLGLDRLFDVAPDALIVADESGRILLWNPAATTIFGWDADEVVGQPLEVLIPDELRARHRAGMARYRSTGHGAYIDTGRLLEFPALRKDGSEIRIQMTLCPVDADGHGRLAAAIVRDVSDQVRLAERERYLAHIVEAASDAVIGKRPDGTVMSWNRAAERMYGFPAAEMLGRPVVGTIIPPERAGEEAEVLRRVLAGESVRDLETERVTKDGRRIFISMTASPILDSSGAIIGESEIERDVSERRLADEQRGLALERLARIGRLEAVEASRTRMLSTATHELKTPLTVLKLHVELLRQALPGEHQGSLDVLERNVDRLARLVQDIVEVARLQAGHHLRMERVDLAEVARASVASFRAPAAAAGLALREDVPGPLPVEGDPVRLGQVLDNFLSNALRFTPAGGEVVVRAAPRGALAAVEVQDSGAGFTPEQRALLFQPFSQAHGRTREGSGLGLFIAKGIVEQHRGSIGADSPGPGQGSTFWFRLPLHA